MTVIPTEPVRGDDLGAIQPARRDDLLAIEALLTECRLPLDGVRDHLGGFLLAFDSGSLAGCCALESYGRSGVLRSLAVAPARRGRGLGSRLIAATLHHARRLGCERIYLLTHTIEHLAMRHGFARIPRESVGTEALASREFAISACSTAVVMRADITPKTA